jgi:NADH:ubiquinone oxidoreductase subunit F (NADH-binding)
MKNVKDMDLLERLEAPTPKRNKRIGRIFTAIGVIAGTILTAGVVTAPLGITILTIVTAVSGGVAVFNGQKVEE